MQRYKVTALTPVALSIQTDRESPPIMVQLSEGETTIARQVLRVIPDDGAPSVNLVPHPSMHGATVKVSGLVEIQQIA
jgi:hypothetical protein